MVHLYKTLKPNRHRKFLTTSTTLRFLKCGKGFWLDNNNTFETSFQHFLIRGLLIFWKWSLLATGCFSSLTSGDTEEASQSSWVHKLKATNGYIPRKHRNDGRTAIIDIQFCSLCRSQSRFSPPENYALFTWHLQVSSWSTFGMQHVGSFKYSCILCD